MKKSRDKQKEAPDLSSLLVFGYACKLFRDDEKALSLETGSHLIPWMGDSSIKIDRYDGRGHLYHLGGEDGEDTLGELERHEEELCEEERWRALHHDETELAINQEEEVKRAANTKAQVGFNYDEVESKDVVGDGESGVTTFGPEYNENEVEEEEPYKATPDLMLPPMMTTPPTVKLFSVMEKTALFLADQGPQMEILLKAKQAGNPVFEFLGMEHRLHPFYRHLVGLVKSKQYKRKEVTPPPISLVPQYSDLPSLAPRLNIPTIQYKKSEDCAYSKLINKIKSVAPPPPAPPNPSVPPPPTPPVPPPPTEVKTPQPPPSQPTQPSGPIVIPPPATQTIVDKMASYVARNGRSFEEVVRSKDEARFSFLAPGDVHHRYYLHKLAIYTTGKYDPSVSMEPVTFTVKKTEKVSVVGQETQEAVVSALHRDNSDSDTEETANDNGEAGSENTSETVKVVANDKQKKSSFPSLIGFLPPVSTGASLPPPVLVAEPKLYQEEEDSKEKREQAEKERKKREETNKLRDKLAAKAKEKMVQAAKEKALQLERKRKAAEFLAQLAEKKTTVSSVTRVDGEGGDSSAEEGELLDTDQEQQLGRGTNSCHGPDDTITAVNIWPPPAPPQLVIPTLSTQPEVKNDENSDEGEERRRRKKRKRSRSRESTRSRHKKKRSRSRHKKHKKYKKSRREHSAGSISSGEEEKELNYRERRKRKRRATSSEREEDQASRRSVEREEKHTRRRSVEREEKQARGRSVYLSSDSEPETRVVKKSGDQSSLASRENSQSKIRSREWSRESSQDNEVTVIEDTRVQSKEGTPEVKLAPSKPIEEMIQPALNKMTEDLRAKVRAMLQGGKT